MFSEEKLSLITKALSRIPWVPLLLVFVVFLLFFNLISTERERRSYQLRFNRLTSFLKPEIVEEPIVEKYACKKSVENPEYSNLHDYWMIDFMTSLHQDRKVASLVSQFNGYTICLDKINKYGPSKTAEECVSEVRTKELENQGITKIVSLESTCERIVGKTKSLKVFGRKLISF